MSVAKRVTGTFLVRGSAALASLLLAALLVRVFSLEKFGQYSFALMSVRLAAALCLFSLDSLLLRMLMRNSQRQGTLQKTIARDCMGNAQAIGLAGSAVAAAIATGGVLVDGSAFWRSLLIFSPVVTLHGVVSLQAGVLRAERRDVAAQWVLVGIVALMPLALISLAALSGWAPEFLPEIAILVSYVVAAFAGIGLSGYFPVVHAAKGARNLLMGRIATLRYSSAIHGANVMNYITDWYVQFLVSGTQSFEAVGILRIFQQFTAALALAAQSIEIPFSTEIAQAHIARSHDRLRKLLLTSQLILGSAAVVALLAIFLLSPFILSFFDIDGARNSWLLFLLVAFYAVVLCTGASASALNLMECTGKLVRASFIAMVLAMAVSSIAIPTLGLLGAVIGLGSAVALRALINLYYVRTELRTKA